MRACLTHVLGKDAAFDIKVSVFYLSLCLSSFFLLLVRNSLLVSGQGNHAPIYFVCVFVFLFVFTRGARGGGGCKEEKRVENMRERFSED